MTSPFGIPLHAHLRELDVEGEIAEGRYTVVAPRPHPAVEGYVVEISPRFGVVQLTGLGQSIESDAYGGRVRSVVDSVAAQLQHKYGAPEVVDFIVDDALWDGDRDWARAVAEGERYYGAIWEAGDGAALPDDVSRIRVWATASDGYTTYLTIIYVSTRYEIAEHERNIRLAELL